MARKQREVFLFHSLVLTLRCKTLLLEQVFWEETTFILYVNRDQRKN